LGFERQGSSKEGTEQKKLTARATGKNAAAFGFGKLGTPGVPPFLATCLGLGSARSLTRWTGELAELLLLAGRMPRTAGISSGLVSWSRAQGSMQLGKERRLISNEV